MATPDPEAPREFVVLPGDRRSTELTWNLPGSRVTALVTSRHSEGNLAIFEQSMVRGGGVPLHINHREDESFYLIEGNYRFEVAGVLSELGPGSHIFIPRGVRHRFQYVGESPGKMLIVCQPAGIELAFDELASFRGPIDPANFAALCAKYGIEVLGPPLPPL